MVGNPILRTGANTGTKKTHKGLARKAIWVVCAVVLTTGGRDASDLMGTFFMAVIVSGFHEFESETSPL